MGRLTTILLAFKFPSKILNLFTFRDYWLDKGVNCTRTYREVMGLKRFKVITQNLHFADNEQATLFGLDDKSSPNHDVIFKIRDYMDLASRMYKEARSPGQMLAYDEQVIYVLIKLS